VYFVVGPRPFPATSPHWTDGLEKSKLPAVKPLDITAFPAELAIKWDDGREDFIAFENLRRFCPCAGCMGEKDIMGNLYKAPERPYAAQSFVLRRLDWIGSYAVQPVWEDGHASGIYTWDWLRRVADAQNTPPQS
jgi:DUF971 family protein